MTAILPRLIAAAGRLPRIRLLPTVIFGAAFVLTLKLGTIWGGLDPVIAPAGAIAQEKAATDAPDRPAAQDSGKGNATSGSGGQSGSKASAPQQKQQNQASAAAADKPGDAKGDRAGTAKAWFDPSLVTDSELEVLQKLAARRAELEKRAQELETRERLLQATEKRIDAKLAELKSIQATINGLLEKHDKQKEEQLKSVVKIYENMKPKDAARIFDELDMAILLDVVERMREAKTAPVLANMTPAKAKALTAALAQRRVLPKPTAQGQQ